MDMSSGIFHHHHSSNTPLGGCLVVGFIVLLLLGVAAQFTGNFGRNAGVAEGEARTWAHQLGLDVTGITCNPVDTENDGYVSCSVMTKGAALPYQVECARAMSLQHGCREPKITVPATNVHVHEGSR